MGYLNSPLAVAFGSGTVSTTAVALASLSGLSAELVERASRARITCNANSVAYRYDGGAPTASAGHVIAANGEALIEGGNNVRNVQLIRVGGSDAVVSVTLEY